MRIKTASVLSVCLLALRIGVAAASTELINTALFIHDDHNTTSVAHGHASHGSVEFPVIVAELEKRKGRSGGSRVKPKSKPTTRKKTLTKKTPTKKTPTKKTPTKKTPTKKKPTKPKPAAPKVTKKPVLKPTQSKSMSKSASTTASAKDPYGSCKPKKGAKKGKTGAKAGGKKGVKREEKFYVSVLNFILIRGRSLSTVDIHVANHE